MSSGTEQFGKWCAFSGRIKEKYFKEIFLDVGLCSVALGLNSIQVNAANEIAMINNGAIAEQIVGQLLRTINPPYKGSNAEVDYVIHLL